MVVENSIKHIQNTVAAHVVGTKQFAPSSPPAQAILTTWAPTGVTVNNPVRTTALLASH